MKCGKCGQKCAELVHKYDDGSSYVGYIDFDNPPNDFNPDPNFYWCYKCARDKK